MAELSQPESPQYLVWSAQQSRKKRRYFVLPPAGLSAGIDEADIVLTWDQMPMAVSYHVYLFVVDEWVLQETVTATTYSTPAVTGTYLYGVIADYFSAGLSDIESVEIVVP